MDKEVILKHLNALLEGIDPNTVCARMLTPIQKPDLEAFLAGQPSRLEFTEMNVMLLSSTIFEVTNNGAYFDPAKLPHLEALRSAITPLINSLKKGIHPTSSRRH